MRADFRVFHRNRPEPSGVDPEVTNLPELPAAQLPTRVYTPEPLLRHPALLVRDLARDIAAGRQLAWRLFVRDLKAQYRQTYLGYVWAFLPPLVASFTFIFLQSQGIVNIEGTDIPYAAFAMMGVLLWQVFVDALNAPGNALNQAKPMLAKISFPREAILMAGLYMVLFNFAIRLVLLVGVMAVWQVTPGAGILLFAPAIAALLLCGAAVGLLLAPLSGLYGDVPRAMALLTQFWMLLTPVVYPARTEGLAGMLARWNPVSPLIVTARESLTAQPFTYLPGFLIVAAISAAAALCGLVAFRITMPHLIARMGG